MIETFSTTIKRREMDAVLTCMVDERIGPGQQNNRFSAALKQFFEVDYAAVLRTPKCALGLALKAAGATPGETTIILPALSRAWQACALKDLGYDIIFIDSQSEVLTAPSAQGVARAVNKGGGLLVLSHDLTTAIDYEGLRAIKIPIIEDITNAIAPYGVNVESANDDESVNSPDGGEKNDRPGALSQFLIMTTEERDCVTTGGGAVLMGGGALKSLVSKIDKSELLSDLNSALGLTELREFTKNEMIRKKIFTSLVRVVTTGKNKVLMNVGGGSCARFPVILEGSIKDAIEHAQSVGVEVTRAFCDSAIINEGQAVKDQVPNAMRLAFSCALFPLYPMLTGKEIATIEKVLATLP